MLRLPEFICLAPKTLDEACTMLDKHAGKITILSGGTDVLPTLKNGLMAPRYVLDLGKIPGLRDLQQESDNTLRIGPRASLTTIEHSPVIGEQFPGLSCAAGLVAAKQLRNMGTIGGNIALQPRCLYYNQPDMWISTLGPCLKRGGPVCHAVKGSPSCRAYFAADTAPALIAHQASITIVSTEGQRSIKLKDLYTGDGKTPHNLKSTEIISGITIPLPEKMNGLTTTSVYQKLRLRKAIDFPLAGVAVSLTAKAGRCEDISLVLGAVDSAPVVLDDIQSLFQGKTITQELIDQAAALARKAARPVANTATSPGYRRDMAAALTKRCLKEAAVKAGIIQ